MLNVWVEWKRHVYACVKLKEGVQNTTYIKAGVLNLVQARGPLEWIHVLRTPCHCYSLQPESNPLNKCVVLVLLARKCINNMHWKSSAPPTGLKYTFIIHVSTILQNSKV